MIAGALALGALMAVVPMVDAAVRAAKSESSIVRTHAPQEWRR